MPVAIFKVDFAKAFDTVSWEFMAEVMRHQGLPTAWILWVQNTVLTGSSQIMINGLLGKKIKLKRGVRQGDPLSPLLFILAIDFLARYVEKLTDIHALRMPFQEMTPCLLYVDDALFFVKPEIQQLQALQIMLVVFEKISGLSVNLAKSELLVSQGAQEENQDLANILRCKLGCFPFTYLGLPLSNKRLPRSAFLPLIQRMSSRLEGWAAKHLSIAGRIVLINAVLTSIPTYYMTCLKMPKWVIGKMDRIRRRFLWHGVSPEQKKMSLINWNVVCMPKEHGGLGIMDFGNFQSSTPQVGLAMG